MEVLKQKAIFAPRQKLLPYLSSGSEAFTPASSNGTATTKDVQEPSGLQLHTTQKPVGDLGTYVCIYIVPHAKAALMYKSKSQVK